MTKHLSLWDRLAARTKPSGALAVIENPRTVVLTVFLWTLGSLPSSVLLVALFFWFDEPLTGWIFLGYQVVAIVGWLVFVATGSVRGTFALLMVLGVITAAAVHITMGGYANSGAALMWGTAITTVAVLLFKRRPAIATGVTIAVLAIIFGFFEQTLQASRPPPDPTLPAVLFPFFIVTMLLLMVPVMGFLMSRLSFERERAEGLLLNVLPASVATELKETGTTTTRRYEAISVLFADIVGFTPLSAEMEPEEMVDQLNDVFTHFDQLANKYGCEKIRTIGDNYMVAAGVPTLRDDHAHAIAAMALEMLEHAGSPTGPGLRLLGTRIEIEDGSGVVGRLGRWVLGAATTSGERAPPGLRPGRGVAVGVLMGPMHIPTTTIGPVTTLAGPIRGEPLSVGRLAAMGVVGVPRVEYDVDMSYIPAMGAFDDGSRVRPIPIEDYERVAPEDTRSDDRVEELARKRPWLFIGRRFIEGIPGIRITRR